MVMVNQCLYMQRGGHICADMSFHESTFHVRFACVQETCALETCALGVASCALEVVTCAWGAGAALERGWGSLE